MFFGKPRTNSPAARVQRLNAADAIARSGRGEITIIDVREMAEVAASGKAQGAVHVPLMLIGMRCDPKSPEFLVALDPARPVALYCASGGRSQRAAEMLAGMGFAEVYNIGGLGDWHAAGGGIDAT